MALTVPQGMLARILTTVPKGLCSQPLLHRTPGARHAGGTDPRGCWLQRLLGTIVSLCFQCCPTPFCSGFSASPTSVAFATAVVQADDSGGSIATLAYVTSWALHMACHGC